MALRVRADLGLLTVVFLSLGLGHRTVAQGIAAQVALPVTDTFPSVRSSLPSLPRRENVLRLAPPTEHPVIIALRQARQPLSNDELAAVMGCSGGESSKRTREVADRLVVAKVGKKLAISLR